MPECPNEGSEDMNEDMNTTKTASPNCTENCKNTNLSYFGILDGTDLCFLVLYLMPEILLVKKKVLRAEDCMFLNFHFILKSKSSIFHCVSRLLG